MRIRLEYDDAPVFSTLVGPMGDYRALLVRIDGKPFTVWRTLDGVSVYDKRYIEEIDKVLIATMERMLGKIFLDACAAIPEGVDLVNGGQNQGTRSGAD